MMSILAPILFIGVLITAHELGHHLVAKLFGVRVHVFSIGVGPALVRWQWGETEYQLAYFPFGGYVKIAGHASLDDDPNNAEEVPPEDRGRSLLDKSPAVRALVYLAGPAMNIALAFVILLGLKAVGAQWDEVQANTVGAVDRGMPAGAPGALEAGDVIVEIDGSPTYGFWQTQRALDAYSQGQGPLKLVVERGPDRVRTPVEVTPRTWSETHSMLGFGTDSFKMGFIVGFLTPDVAPTRLDGPLAQAGLRVHDRILRIDGQPIRRYLDALRALAAAPADRPVEIEVEHMTPGAEANAAAPEAERVSAFAHLQAGPAAWGRLPAWRPEYLPPRLEEDAALMARLPPKAPPGTATWRFRGTYARNGPRLLAWRHDRETLRALLPAGDRSEEALGLQPAASCVSFVDPDGPAARAEAITEGEPNGLRAGDCVVEVDGTSHSLPDFILMRLGDKPENPKMVKVRRGGRVLTYQIHPEMLTVNDSFFGDSQHWDPGLMLSSREDWVQPGESVPNVDRLTFAWGEAVSAVPAKLRETVFSVLGLFSGAVSPKQLSGPLTILYIAGKSVEAGLDRTLDLMAVISLGLAIFNLVPVPGLDGGHILVATIELVSRRRVSPEWQRRIQTVGLACILLLVLFVLTQDVGRFL